MKDRRVGILAVAIALLAIVAAIRLVLGLTFDGYVISGRTMEPTLMPGDRILSRSVSGDDVSRGDVVIFSAPDAESREELVSRVVAVGGDEVDDDAGFLKVNGGRAEEPYLAAGTMTQGLRPLRAPDGQVFLMGDNRPASFDSRRFGPVPTTYVRRLVVVRWWPPGQLGGL